MITDGLLWKDTISGRSESSTCVLSKHTGKKRDQLCTLMELIHPIHIQRPLRGITGGGGGAGLKTLIYKERLIIIHTGNSTLNSLYSTQTSHCSNNRFLILNQSILVRTTVKFHTHYSFNIPIWFKKWRLPQRHVPRQL
jgi:hypothetical protein